MAVAFTYAARFLSNRFVLTQGVNFHLAVLALGLVLVGASRDALRKYYARAGAVLGSKHGR